MQSTRRRNSLLAKTESLLPARVIAALAAIAAWLPQAQFIAA